MFELKRRKTDIVSADAPTGKEYTTTFSRDYVIGKIEIDKISKAGIVKYIATEAKQLLGTEDFYYGYIYEKKVLKYIMHKNDKHVVGSASVLSTVLLNPGKYYIIDASNIYIFENIGNEIRDKIDFIENDYDDNGTDNLGINLLETKVANVPETLLLKWSLEKRNISLITILAIVFITSALIYVNESKNYKQLTEKANDVKQQYLTAQNLKKVTPNVDIATFIKNVVKSVDGKGILTKILAESNKIQITIQFKNEYDAQNYIKTNGGNYENGKVVLGTMFVAGK
ncbi:MAG: hypothetical protein WCI04_07380 [archaeon]